MSLPKAVADCSVCPRLCRDVCPVAVHGFRDDLIPSEKMRGAAATLGHTAGEADLERLLACTDCGACSAYCLLSVPVSSWLDEALSELAQVRQRAPTSSPCQAVAAADLPQNVVLLPVCTAQTTEPRHHQVRGAPHAPADAPAGAKRCDPMMGNGHDAAPTGVHAARLGSTCCGERLDPRVGDAGIRERMAGAMLSDVPDGAVVAVTNPACGAHLQAVAGERLRVVVIVGDPANTVAATNTEGAGSQ